MAFVTYIGHQKRIEIDDPVLGTVRADKNQSITVSDSIAPGLIASGAFTAADQATQNLTPTPQEYFELVSALRGSAAEDEVLTYKNGRPEWRPPSATATLDARYAAAPGTNYKLVTVDHTKVAGPLTDLTLALDLTADAAIAAHAKPDLSDVRFTDINGAPIAYEVESSGGSEMTVDLGWCFFNGPRAICVQGGGHNRVFLGGVKADGSVGVTQLDVDTGGVASFTLDSFFETLADDHDAPGLYVRPDGKLQAFYSSHNSLDGKIYQRTSSAANDATAWGAETNQVFGAGTQNVSYPKPFLLSSQGTPGTGRLYLFWRNNNAEQMFATSDDLGATWSAAKILFSNGAQRPYFTCPVSNGTDRIDFLCTDGHPSALATSLYHFYYSAADDSFHRSDGSVITTRAALNATTGIVPADLDATSSRIFTAGGAEKRSWGWDICYDTAGRPVVAYATFPDDVNFLSHRYWYGRWTGSAWQTALVSDAGPATDATGPNPAGTVGPWIGPAPQAGQIEKQYSGGISILRSDTSKVYLSKRVVGPIADQSTWELEQWTSTDTGLTWARSKRITPQSKQKNVRPLCPNNPGALSVAPPDVFWMHGGYYHYRRFSTSLLAYPPIAAIPVVRGARVKVPAVDAVTDVQLVMRYNSPAAKDASLNPYGADARLAVPLIGRSSSGNVWHHADVQLSGLAAFTLTAWAAINGNDGINDYIFSNWLESGITAPAVMLRMLNGAVSAFMIVQPDTQVGGAFADKTGLNTGALHHYALVYDGAALKLYVDGVVSTTTFATTAALDSSQGLSAAELQQPSFIGSSAFATPQRPVKGTIYDVRLHASAKSAAWIQTQAKGRTGLYAVGAEA